MREKNGFLAIRIGLALCVTLACILWAVAQHSDVAGRQVSTPEDVRAELRRAQLLAPPSESAVLYDAGQFEYVPANEALACEFVEGLVSRLGPGGREVWPVSVYEEAASRETVFLNADGAEVFRLSPEAGYDPGWTARFLFPGWQFSDSFAFRHDPSRVIMAARLVGSQSGTGGAPSVLSGKKVTDAAKASAGNSGRRLSSAPSGYKDYLVVWNSSSNIWLGGASGAAACVVAIDAGYSHGVALHGDGSVTRVGLDPETLAVTERRFESAGAAFASAGGLGDTVVSGFDGALRHVSGAGELLGEIADTGNITEIAVGAGFFIALKNGGTLLSSGAEGSLLPPSGLSGVAEVDAGPSFCVARRHNGAVVAWGDARVATNIASGVSAVSASRRGAHCLALNRDGTVTAWGDDGYGQCRVPAGLTGVRAIAAGGCHSVALKSDGTVACWGLVRHAPPLLTNVVSVGASYLDACAVTAGGTVAVWGRGCPSGCALLSAKTPGVCEILDARIVDCGIYMAVVRAREGVLEGDADGDGVSGVDEVFLLGTDPLTKDAGAYAKTAAGEAKQASATKKASVESVSSLRAAGMALYSFENGATYYADAGMTDDSGDGQTWETAKRTVQAAVDLAAAGDTVMVAPGTYSEGARVTPGGLFQNRLVITNGVLVKSSGGPGATVIQGSGAEAFDSWSAVRCVYIVDGVLDGFTLRGGAAVGYWTSADARDRSGGCLNMFMATEESEARNCVIDGGTAYDGGGAWFGRLVNCVIRSCGAYYGAGAYWSVLLNCTVSGNSAWCSCGGARNCGVTNSVVYGNTTGWESPECHCSTVSRSCSDLENFGLGNTAEDVLFADPLFADAGSGDFSLQAVSPCLDAGCDDFVTADTDLQGNPRIQGAAVDMGAYEFLIDTDGDGVPDFRDAFPLDAAAWLDTDGDGMPDELHGTSTTGLVEDTDDDNDGLPDWWEIKYSAYGFDPLVPAPADSGDLGLYGDPDGDGLDNLGEALLGTEPFNPDTDGDGLGDGEETEVPFLTLWDPADLRGSVLLGCKAVQVTASDTARAALLSDGRVIVFASSGSGLKAYTNNDCVAVEIDATESWIAARTSAGRVSVWPAATNSSGFADAGLTNVVGLSGGCGHLLALHADGQITCLKSGPSGTPVILTNTFCAAAGTNAVLLAAGASADAAILKSGKLLLGDVFCSTSTALVTTAFAPFDVVAGSNRNFIVQMTNGQSDAYYYSSSYIKKTGPTETLFIAGGGSSNMVAVLSNGSNAVFSSGESVWNYALVTNRLSDARDLWWKRDCMLAVTNRGFLLPLSNASSSGRRLDYFAAAVTPRGVRLGIAAACSGTCPTNGDTDADGLLDGWEIENGFNPLDPSDVLRDTDVDGMPDWWEIENGFNLSDGSDAGEDADGDGVTNALECHRETDPRDPASVNRTFYADSDVGNISYDGYSPSFQSGQRGPAATVQQAIGTAILGDTIEMRGASAFADRTLTPGGKAIILRPVGSVRF